MCLGNRLDRPADRPSIFFNRRLREAIEQVGPEAAFRMVLRPNCLTIFVATVIF